MWFFKQALLLSASLSEINAFQGIFSPQQRVYMPQLSQGRGSSSALFESKDEEIAKLEEQLKKLKEEATTEEIATPEVQELEESVSEELFLTEKWKESETEAKEGGGLIGILGAVGLALFFALFSQVPVGQEDLSKYSAIKAPTEQIDLGDLNRSRNAGSDL